MTITSLHRVQNPQRAEIDSRFEELEDRIIDLRVGLLTRLSAGLAEFAAAAEMLDELRAPGLYDVELAEGRDGRDVAARIDGAICDARSAYAVLQMVFAGENTR